MLEFLLQSQHDVLAGSHPGEQAVVLEHNASVKTRADDVLAILEDLAGGGLFQAC